jgi:2-phosphoglycolate phosphatase
MTPLVVFDLDGTLVDSRRDLADSTNELLERCGAAPLPIDAVTRMVGEGARVLVRRALAAAGLAGVDEDAALDRFRAIYDRRLLDHTRPYPGIVDTVRQCAARATLAVLTNKPAEPSRRILDTFEFSPSLRWVVGGDSPLGRKPDPAGLRQIMAWAGVDADRTVLVGDSRIDVETGRRAGVRVCGAHYGFGGVQGPDALVGAAWTIAAPADLLEVLDRCFAPHYSSESTANHVNAQSPLVLIVDDFQDARDLYCSYLGSHGFRVAEAANGLEAYDRAVELVPDVIIMDLAMPVMDGWEATRRIKGHQSTRDIPVVALTGHASPGVAERAMAAGCERVIIKPFLPHELTRLIGELLNPA